jgi:hypothetical protein
MNIGAGLSGQLALRPLPSATASGGKNEGSLQDLSIAPGVAPWAAGRMGFAGSNEAGLTYAGRSLRLDARHAFALGRNEALSVGLGGSAVIARRPGEGNDASSVYGGGADLPVLIGVRSASDLYAVWFGPRGGFEIMSGRLQLGDPASVFDVSARHFYATLTAGVRVGFRHVYLAIEVDGGYHHIDGTFQPSGKSAPASTNVQQISLTLAGALQVSF